MFLHYNFWVLQRAEKGAAEWIPQAPRHRVSDNKLQGDREARNAAAG